VLFPWTGYWVCGVARIISIIAEQGYGGRGKDMVDTANVITARKQHRADLYGFTYGGYFLRFWAASLNVITVAAGKKMGLCLFTYRAGF
jgi:hypothetical protein